MAERYAVKIDGAARIVELQEVDGKLRVLVDGRERLVGVDARPLGAGVWSLIHEQGARLVQIDGQFDATKGKLTVEVSHPDGEPRICLAEIASAGEDGPGASGASAPPVSGPLTLHAPIPGRLVRVLVRVGDEVKVGQTLLVLEAMKMENELRAPRAGMVSALHAAEGAAVESGQSLLTLS